MKNFFAAKLTRFLLAFLLRKRRPQSPSPLGREAESNWQTVDVDSVKNGLDHRGTHVLLEGLVEEKGEYHRNVKGGIGGKPLEGQLLEAEILQRPVYHFMATPAVVTGENLLRLKLLAVSSLDRHRNDAMAHAQLGDQHSLGPGKGQQQPSVFIKWPAKQRAAKSLPIGAPGALARSSPRRPRSISSEPQVP